MRDKGWTSPPSIPRRGRARRDAGHPIFHACPVRFFCPEQDTKSGRSLRGRHLSVTAPLPFPQPILALEIKRYATRTHVSKCDLTRGDHWLPGQWTARQGIGWKVLTWWQSLPGKFRNYTPNHRNDYAMQRQPLYVDDCCKICPEKSDSCRSRTVSNAQQKNLNHFFFKYFYQIPFDPCDNSQPPLPRDCCLLYMASYASIYS